MRINLSAPITVAAAAGPDGEPRRRIDGLAVPWNVTANASTGPVRFLPGSLPEDGPAPKLIRDHDSTRPIGIVAERVATDEGMMFSARIAATVDGDEALVLAADGVLDAVSVGVEPIDYELEDGVLVVSAGRWLELSLVAFGAFPAARVHQVAATPADDPEPTTPEPTPEQESPAMSDTTPAPADEATIPTAPIIVASDRARPITAAGYLSAVASGRITPAVQAVAAEQGTGDTPGILPEPLVGQVYDNLRLTRPFISAIGTLAMPAGGEVFNRRKITQHVAVTEQVDEFDELASQKMTIAKVPVTKRTYGGYVDLSEQELDWTDPAAVNLVLTDMGKVYAFRTETVACAALVAGATVTDTIADYTDGDEVLDALYDASATIMAATDELPTHLFLAPNRWASMGKMKNANGDRLFVQVGPMNVSGTMNPGTFTVQGLGLTVVVSPRFAAGSMIVGHPSGIELYEQNKGSIRVDQPATLSTRIAWRGYFATAILNAGAFVKFI